MLAIADAAGGEWPERARAAAAAGHVAGGDEASLIELLLGDIRDIFAKREANKVEPVTGSRPATWSTALVAIEGRPWAELGKSRKPLTQNGLARRLRPLSIAPTASALDENGRPRATTSISSRKRLRAIWGLRGVPNRNSATMPMKRAQVRAFKAQQPSPMLRLENARSPHNDGPCCGVEDGKGDVGGSAHVGDGNGLAPGLSQRTITELADDYTEAAYRQNQEGADIDSRTLDADLRRRLAEMVLPEFVEVEFERVMAEVFRV